MANLCSYFVKNVTNLKPPSKNIIIGTHYRFEVLSPRLIRIEYNKNNFFEDRATSLVVSRNLGDTTFTHTETDVALTITTEYFTLTYIKGNPISGNNIKVLINGTDREWTPNNKEIRNLGSLSYSLDNLDNTKLKLNKGLYSFDGFVVLDDSKNLVIDNENFNNREETTDLYLFVYRSDLGLCLQDYFSLTGYPPMIPRYALGSWWYKNDIYNMYDIDLILKKFNDNHIPISVFLLGNKWHSSTESFTFNRSLFDLNILNAYFKSKTQKFGLTINPELPITPVDPWYNELSKYLKTNKNNLSFLPLNNNTLNAYLNLVVNNLLQYGIKLFNIDYYNPQDKQGLFLLNHYHYVISNLNERGLILSRNPGIAPHRYPIIYSGRTKVSWDTLKVLPAYNNSASNLGVCWHAHAIGGYYGGIEDDELYIRYIQFGVFNPIFILAGDTGKYYKREPWKWNQIKLSVIKEYMQLRNKLIPYIYNEGYIYHKFGIPIVQPLYYKYPKIYDEPNYVNQYFFGSKIMISPIIKKKNIEMNRVVQRVFIPNGIWYDYTSGKKFIGNKYYVGFYKEEDYPIFIKEGAIIPMSLDKDTNCPQNMEIQIFPAENGLYGNYELYEDDGYNLNPGRNYLITKMNLDKVEYGYKFTIARKEGNLNLPNRNYLLRFRNMNSPENILVKQQNTEEKYPYEIEKNDLIIHINNVNVYNTIEVNIYGKNLEIETISVINEEIEGILDDLEINTILKEEIDDIIFSELPVNKKRIGLRKLRKHGLEPKFINMFIGLLAFIETK